MKRGLHREDKNQGWQIRFRYVQVNETPESHGIRINGLFGKLPNIQCDTCGQTINHTLVVATTMWMTSRESEPRLWEEEFGTILTAEVVVAIDKLSAEQPNRKDT